MKDKRKLKKAVKRHKTQILKVIRVQGCTIVKQNKRNLVLCAIKEGQTMELVKKDEEIEKLKSELEAFRRLQTANKADTKEDITEEEERTNIK